MWLHKAMQKYNTSYENDLIKQWSQGDITYQEMEKILEEAEDAATIAYNNSMIKHSKLNHKE